MDDFAIRTPFPAVTLIDRIRKLPHRFLPDDSSIWLLLDVMSMRHKNHLLCPSCDLQQMIYCLGSVSPPFCSTWSSFTQLTPAAPSLLPLAPFWLLPLRFKASIPAALFMLSDYSGCSVLVQLEALLRYATFSRCWLIWVNWVHNLLILGYPLVFDFLLIEN